jgi:hypothetical protein
MLVLAIRTAEFASLTVSIPLRGFISFLLRAFHRFLLILDIQHQKFALFANFSPKIDLFPLSERLEPLMPTHSRSETQPVFAQNHRFLSHILTLLSHFFHLSSSIFRATRTTRYPPTSLGTIQVLQFVREHLRSLALAFPPRQVCGRCQGCERSEAISQVT